MDDFLRAALEIVKAQASVRTMTEEEIIRLARNLTASLKAITACEASGDDGPSCEPGKAIKEKSITCCACGKSVKVLTKKHLAAHGLTPAEYREKYGFKKGTPLVCKSLQRDRRKKMTEMKLWTKRKKFKGAKTRKAPVASAEA